jgi:hypothetical protein
MLKELPGCTCPHEADHGETGWPLSVEPGDGGNRHWPENVSAWENFDPMPHLRHQGRFCRYHLTTDDRLKVMAASGLNRGRRAHSGRIGPHMDARLQTSDRVESDQALANETVPPRPRPCTKDPDATRSSFTGP